MDQYGNFGPFQDPRMREYYDSLPDGEPVEGDE